MIKCHVCHHESGTNLYCNHCLLAEPFPSPSELTMNDPDMRACQRCGGPTHPVEGLTCTTCKGKLNSNSKAAEDIFPIKETTVNPPKHIHNDPDHYQCDYVRLASGTKFFLHNPSKNKGLRVVDLIVPIAEISRYNFHLATHYSVAEHCYYCSQRCSIPLYGLIHDLSEAIIGDLPAPIKVLCPDYKKVELRIEKWIYTVFGLDPINLPFDLKTVDKRMLATEQLHFGRTADSIDEYPPYMDIRIGCWKPVYAVLKYFERLQELTNHKFNLDTVLEMPEQPDDYFEPITGTPAHV